MITHHPLDTFWHDPKTNTLVPTIGHTHEFTTKPARDHFASQQKDVVGLTQWDRLMHGKRKFWVTVHTPRKD